MENLSVQTIYIVLSSVLILVLLLLNLYYRGLKRNLEKVIVSDNQKQKALAIQMQNALLEKLENTRQNSSVYEGELTKGYMHHFSQLIEGSVEVIAPQKVKFFRDRVTELTLLNGNYLRRESENKFVCDYMAAPIYTSCQILFKEWESDYRSFNCRMQTHSIGLVLPKGIQAGILRLLFSLVQITRESTRSIEATINISITPQAFVLDYYDPAAAQQAHKFAPAVEIAQTMTDKTHISFVNDVFCFTLPMQELDLITNQPKTLV